MATISEETDAMRDPDEKKSLKVKLATRSHIRLHSLRILTDRTISGIVQEAVQDYFDRLDDDTAETLDEAAGVSS